MSDKKKPAKDDLPIPCADSGGMADEDKTSMELARELHDTVLKAKSTLGGVWLRVADGDKKGVSETPAPQKTLPPTLNALLIHCLQHARDLFRRADGLNNAVGE